MLLIFGLRIYFRTVGQGTFHCQRCGGDRPYRRRSGRRWIHLFFVPLIPLDRVGEYVQCDTCRAKYRTEALRMPTTAQMQAALPAGMQAAAIAMLRSGDPASVAARQHVIEAVKGAGLAGYDEAGVEADLAGLGVLADELGTRLNVLAGQLEMPAREWFLAEIVRVGLADGPLTDPERQAVHAIAAGLGMTSAQTLGVIALTEQAASAG